MFPKRILAPGFLTIMNLFLGFYAIISSSKGDFVTASWLIILSAIFDAFDGKVARATKSMSRFGVEFDSLADVTSFGLAPSFLMYQLHLNKMGPAGLIISFFPLMFGAIRLARFNVEVAGPEKVNFKGLPIPAAAGTLASFVIFNFNIWQELWIPSLILPLVILVSILMVSTLEFDALPKFNFRSGKKNSIHLIVLLAGVILSIFFPQKAAFPLLAAYIIYATVRGLLRLGKDGDGGRRKRRIFKKATQEYNRVA
jgi:CDP-diacylglycerol--serine O-phosphatidyltransferase